jgi:glycosyltransferase involved in cell wall biosynthesis
MKLTPKVSVLIPLYNCSKYIDQAVESVLNQTYSAFELIIVDNCSTDGSFEKVRKYNTDERVKIFRNDTNIGMARNFNQCILYSRGEYIKFLCSDDYFEHDLLEEYVKIMERFPSVTLVTSPRRFLYEDGHSQFYPYFEGIRNGADLYQQIMKNGLNPIGEPTTVMFRRRELNIGLFNTDMHWVCDIDYWLRLMLLGDVYCFPTAYSIFRQTQEQGTIEVKRTGKFFFEEAGFIFYNHVIRRYSEERGLRDYKEKLLSLYKIYKMDIDERSKMFFFDILPYKAFVKLKYSEAKVFFKKHLKALAKPSSIKK